MARTLTEPVLSFTVACVLACASGKTDGDAPPFTTGGSAGTSTTGNGGAVTNSGAGRSESGGSDSNSNGGTNSGSTTGESSGGSSSPNGNGGASGGSNMPNTQLPNGYWSTGSWKGRAWGKTTGTDSTMMPGAFDSVPFGMPYCASGSVGAMPDYSGTATIGVNLNQDSGAGAAANTVTPSKDGISVSVTNKGGSALRLELRGPNAETDTAQRWCAPISGSGGFIPWSSFNTACWDNSGAAYNREPIVSAAVLVPGSNSSAVAYDVCLNSLNEGMPGSNTGSGGASGGGGASNAGGASNSSRGGASNSSNGGSGTAGSGTAGSAGGGPKPIMNTGTLMDRYDWQPVEHDGHNYVVQNNVWGSGASQTVTYNETSFKVTAQSGTNGTNGAPVSYPSTFIGANYERATTGSNLPKLVSSIASVQTSWTNNAGGGIGGTYNASYDVWFSTKAEGDLEAPSGGYLMVWFYDPANAQPIGSVVASNVSVSGVSGSWNIWQGNNGNVPCISYVRTQAIQSMTFDLNAFIQHAVGRGTIKSNWYLSNVFAGFEIWNGGVGLESSGFYAIVN